MTFNRILFEPGLKTLIYVESKRIYLLLICQRKKAADFVKKVKIPKDNLTSLTNLALNVELVYVILLGMNTIVENRCNEN